MAALSGPGRAVAELLAAAVLPPEADVLGPIPLDGAAAGQMNRRGLAKIEVSAEADEGQ